MPVIDTCSQVFRAFREVFFFIFIFFLVAVAEQTRAPVFLLRPSVTPQNPFLPLLSTKNGGFAHRLYYDIFNLLTYFNEISFFEFIVKDS